MDVLTARPEAALARRHSSQADSAGGTSSARPIDNVDSGEEPLYHTCFCGRERRHDAQLASPSSTPWWFLSAQAPPTSLHLPDVDRCSR